jgi:hypothetical protein
MRRKIGTDLICRRHGEQHAVIREMAPKSRPPYEVACKFYSRRGKKQCSHNRSATSAQAMEILKAHPECDAQEYQPSAWDTFFFRAPGK